MAVPKKRTTHSAQGQRRSHDALKAAAVTACGNCGKDIRPHHACAACGLYRGRKVLKV
ncbi:MAG TPA: 50S ribosomal protein L32 [Candidatus Saccharimonadales bacterium]|nr:50S ribosomal protein L32 [Candidatus Saccharimonadales bacterium]